jgi:hypothetical protein
MFLSTPILRIRSGRCAHAAGGQAAAAPPKQRDELAASHVKQSSLSRRQRSSHVDTGGR